MALVDRLTTLLLAAGAVGVGAWAWPWPWLRLPAWDPAPAVAVAGGVLLHRLLRRRFRVLPILEHELAHALVAALLMGRILEIRAAEDGGHAVHTAGGVRATFVRLAPYLLPLAPLVVLPFRWVVRPELLPAWTAVYAGAWGYEAARVLADLHPRQPDLLRGGLLPSWVAVAACNALGWSWLALAAPA